MSSGTSLARTGQTRDRGTLRSPGPLSARDWFVVDADGQVLGRLATGVARVLTGKHRPSWLPYLDTGDFVVVTNAEKVKLTGAKADQKIYRRHSGFPGGLKSVTARELTARHPERIIENAVRGMLPKSKLGRKQIKKLKVYRGAEHPHQAQQPKTLKLPARAAKP